MSKTNRELLAKFTDPRLNRTDTLVLFLLSIMDNLWSEGQSQLADTLGLHRQTVNRSVGRLEKIGYIKRLNGKPKPIILTI